MKNNKQSFGHEFSSRLNSGDWDRKMHARIENERKDRTHVRVRIMAFVSALFLGVFAITATWWDEDTTSNNLYSSVEEVTGGLQMQVSFTE